MREIRAQGYKEINAEFHREEISVKPILNSVQLCALLHPSICKYYTSRLTNF